MSLLATLAATLIYAIGSLVTMTLVVAIATGAQPRIGPFFEPSHEKKTSMRTGSTGNTPFINRFSTTSPNRGH